MEQDLREMIGNYSTLYIILMKPMFNIFQRTVKFLVIFQSF